MMLRLASFFKLFWVCIFCTFSFISSIAFPQTLKTDALIEGFKARGVHQTNKFSELCSDLLINFNETNFNLTRDEIKAYLAKNNDARVQVRMFIYERFAYAEMRKPDPFNTPEYYLKIIKLASLLGDEQLLSELYCKYAELCTPSKKLYYLLKCIEIREHVGLKYFTDVSANYYSASELLYSITDYKSSSMYAARGLTLFTEKEKREYLFHYILATDIAGASYLKINNPDSAIYYYTHIGNLVDDRLAHPKHYKSPMTSEALQIWRGVVNGGLGKAYLLQKKYDKAYNLLLQNLQSSTNFKQWDDVAGVQNALATVDHLRGRRSLTLARYLYAYRLALQSHNLPILVTSAHGISSVFADQKKFDSAYVYQKKYLQHKEVLDKNLSQSRLDIIRAQVDFEKMNKTLIESQNNLRNQKRIRNSILIAIVFLTAIALLLYNRKSLLMRLQNEKLEKEKQKLDSERINAQQQIDIFVQKIAEKNNLIKELHAQLSDGNTSITNALSHFTILTEEDWQKFKINFETINPGYLQRLKQKMPQITLAEQRIILLAKLDLTTKEMANATGVSPETIRSVSSRMRKKFSLTTGLHTIANEI